MRDIKTREGFEFWDKLNALPRYAFLLSPSGKSVQKFEDQVMGNWIDVHEAQKIVDQAQERISELQEEVARQKQYVEINANSAQGKHLEGQLYRDERDALQAELTSANADKAAYGKNAVDLRLRVDALQSELTKARELLVRCQPRLSHCSLLDDVREYLSNQSAPADKGQGEPITYSSTQATNCAGCGKYKHTPLRVDGMGGYVCLTCIDERLEKLLDAEQPGPAAVVLAEAREWLGDGKNADGLAREHWTPEYAALIDRIDATLPK